MTATGPRIFGSRPPQTAIPPSDASGDLFDDLANFTHDPLGYVYFAFPWGEPSSPLANEEGPDSFQVEILRHIGQQLQAGMSTPEAIQRAIQIAAASGHGVGKSCLIAWLIKWSMATCEDTRGVVTANTEKQLTTKTWPELAKWHGMAIDKDYFELTATAYFARDPDHAKTWRIDQVPWSEKNVEAFAGLHNKGKRIVVFFDEGSAIPDVIWETTEGALTDADTEIIWVAFGNPTRNTGRFRECFESLAHRWKTWQIDSRSARHTNKVQIEAWVKDYGEDSDFIRVRVRGVFPRQGAQQLISSELLDLAMKREAMATVWDPLVVGVDVARFGDDQSVIAIRKGRDGRSHPPKKFRGIDTMALAEEVKAVAEYYHPDAIFIDGGGVGGGVVDRCRQLGLVVIEVNFGGKPDGITQDQTRERYYNKRAEIWGSYRQAIRDGLALPDDPELRKQTTQQTYEFRSIRGGDAIILTSKEAMKLEGMDSPDVADAYAITYSYRVMPSAERMGGMMAAGNNPHVMPDYDPFALSDNLETIH